MLYKLAFVFFTCVMVCIPSVEMEAQVNLYDYVKLGAYPVGFADTTILDAQYDYEAYGYKGKKPYFIQVWHPMVKQTAPSPFLSVNDFIAAKPAGKFATVQNQLAAHQKEFIISDCIAENLTTGQTNHYGDFTHEDIFNLIGALETKSSLHAIDTTANFPVILYHHGSQSHSAENFAMAEYFASRGFIFLAANFHLPFENTVFGLKPFEFLVKDEDEESLRTIVRFAQSLTHSPAIFFIGHSWGAQMGLRTFDQDSSIHGMISLETTLEFKSDDEVIKEMWPEVYRKIVLQKSNYPFPILLCAATGQAKPFYFFANLNAPQVTYAPTKAQFEHNAYTSTFYLRYFIKEKVEQPDQVVLEDRLKLYVRHLEFMHDFINGILTKEERPLKETVFIEYD